MRENATENAPGLPTWETLTDAQKGKHKRRICVLPCCGVPVPAIRNKGKATGRYYLVCSKHRRQHYRNTHPFNYAFDNLRKRARQRGHEFTLTLEQFTRLYLEAGVQPFGNKHRLGASIDRIDARHGYHSWNVQIITLGENARKRFSDYREAA